MIRGTPSVLHMYVCDAGGYFFCRAQVVLQKVQHFKVLFCQLLAQPTVNRAGTHAKDELAIIAGFLDGAP